MERSAAGRGEADGTERDSQPDPHSVFARSLDRTVGAALREGIAPDSPAAAEVVDRLLDHPGPERRAAVRARIRAQLDAGIDGRLERYRRLLAILQDQQPPTPPHRRLVLAGRRDRRNRRNRRAREPVLTGPGGGHRALVTCVTNSHHQ